MSRTNVLYMPIPLAVLNMHLPALKNLKQRMRETDRQTDIQIDKTDRQAKG